MQKLECTLIGVPQVTLNGIRVQFPYKKCEALFYYLCVRKSVSREEALSILWADCSQNGARKNLRDAIYNLRKLLGNDIVLTEGHNRVVLNPDIIARLDYDIAIQTSLYERYHEDFLAYFYVKDCVEFEEWANSVRNDLLHRFTLEMDDRIDAAALAQDSKTLKELGKTMLRKKILDEEMFRKVLSGLIRCGCYAEMTELYEQLCEFLMNELGAEPEKKTVTLVSSASALETFSEEPPNGELDTSDSMFTTQFFGRKAEVTHFLNQLNGFRRGGTSSLLLVGDSGVGKTTLLNHLMNVFPSNEFCVVTHDCVESEKDLPLKAWYNLQEQIRLACSAKLGDSSAKMVDAPSIQNAGDGNLLHFSVSCEYMTESMIQNLASIQKKTVMFLDDLQWMDHNSLQLLSNLLYWSKKSRVFIIMAARADPYPELTNFKVPLIARHLLEELVIPNFTVDETCEIIRSFYPKMAQERLSKLLDMTYQLTSGNAFFLFEYLSSCDFSTGDLHPPELSTSASYMVKSRLLGLSSQDMELLYCISVFPRFATLDELVLLTGWPKLDVLNHLDSSLSIHIIQQRSTYNKQGYGFIHRIVQDYILDSMLPDKRQLFHTILAEYYESNYLNEKDQGSLPYVIYNYGHAHNDYKFFLYRLEYARILGATQYDIFSLSEPFSLSSGEIEMSQYTFYGVEDFLDFDRQIHKALSKPDEIEKLSMRVKFLIGRCCFAGGQYEQGYKNIQSSLELARKYQDATYLMENYLQLIYHSIQVHNLKLFYDCILNCDDLLTKHTYSNHICCDVLRLKGLYYMKNYRYQLADEIFEQLIVQADLYCKSNPSYRIIQGTCYNYLGENCQTRGKFEQALTRYQDAIRCCEGDLSSNGIGVFYTNAGIVLYKMGRYQEAKSYIDKAIDYFSIFHSLWYSARTHAYAALLALQAGDFEAAQHYLKTAKKIAVTSKNPLTDSLLQDIERTITNSKDVHSDWSFPPGEPLPLTP